MSLAARQCCRSIFLTAVPGFTRLAALRAVLVQLCHRPAQLVYFTSQYSASTGCSGFINYSFFDFISICPGPLLFLLLGLVLRF